MVIRARSGYVRHSGERRLLGIMPTIPPRNRPRLTTAVPARRDWSADAYGQCINPAVIDLLATDRSRDVRVTVEPPSICRDSGRGGLLSPRHGPERGRSACVRLRRSCPRRARTGGPRDDAPGPSPRKPRDAVVALGAVVAFQWGSTAAAATDQRGALVY